MARKKKKSKILLQIIILIILLLLLFFTEQPELFEFLDVVYDEFGVVSAFENTFGGVKKDQEIISRVSEDIIIDKNKLNILFLDVGQADCELIVYKGKTILIDAGNSKDGPKIVNGLKALNINKIDYVIGTHVHEDHIGGMSYIIDEFDIGKFYLPYNTQNTMSYYTKLLNSLNNKNLSINEANIGDKFFIEDIACEIMSVDNSEPEDANLSSIVLEVRYKNLKYLFMGDAEIENEKSRIWNDVDVLKVGHHGSNSSSSEKFLKQVLPEIAVIPVGRDNSYELPKNKVLNRFSKLGTDIYRTDLDGTIQIVSDGNQNEIVKIEISFDGN